MKIIQLSFVIAMWLAVAALAHPVYRNTDSDLAVRETTSIETDLAPRSEVYPEGRIKHLVKKLLPKKKVPASTRPIHYLRPPVPHKSNSTASYHNSRTPPKKEGAFKRLTQKLRGRKSVATPTGHRITHNFKGHRLEPQRHNTTAVYAEGMKAMNYALNHRRD